MWQFERNSNRIIGVYDMDFATQTTDFRPFAGVWMLGGTLVFALWIIARAKLTFHDDRFERISGLCRQFVDYDAISRVEW